MNFNFEGTELVHRQFFCSTSHLTQWLHYVSPFITTLVHHCQFLIPTQGGSTWEADINNLLKKWIFVRTALLYLFKDSRSFRRAWYGSLNTLDLRLNWNPNQSVYNQDRVCHFRDSGVTRTCNIPNSGMTPNGIAPLIRIVNKQEVGGKHIGFQRIIPFWRQWNRYSQETPIT